MTTLKRYRVYCVTEAANVIGDFRETEPTTCPNNNTHVIDSTLNTVVAARYSSTVTIKEEDIPTRGYFRCDGHELSIPAGMTGDISVHEIVYDFPTTVLSFQLEFTNEHVGDRMWAWSMPTTPLGLIEADLPSGSTSVIIPLVMMQFAGVGLCVFLEDPISGITEVSTEIATLDPLTRVATLHSPLNNSFLLVSNSTIRPAIPRVKQLKVVSPGVKGIGDKKIGGSSAPVGIKALIQYQNNNGLAKELVLHADLLF